MALLCRRHAHHNRITPEDLSLREETALLLLHLCKAIQRTAGFHRNLEWCTRRHGSSTIISLRSLLSRHRTTTYNNSSHSHTNSHRQGIGS